MTTQRKQIADMLRQPRTLSSVAHELKLTREEVEEHLKHLLKTAKTAGQDVKIEPARCRSCGYTFGVDKVTKPGKCPECKGTRLYEPLIQIKM
jgi:predicted Zn-ribbon and HTH transcriptional regulator